MNRLEGFAVAFAVTILVGLTLVCQAQPPNPIERIDYWRTHYEELQPGDDDRVERAHRIFDRILDAAGRRPGVPPRLLIIKEDPCGVSLPISIPDGSVILSGRVLDFCYEDPRFGDDRLAFVLGHEIAHQLRDDFWHMRFFQVLKESGDPHLDDKAMEGSPSADEVLAKELQADEYGIIYASIAGFDTRAVVAEEPEVNFFEEWAEAQDPDRIGLAPGHHSHPSPRQRASYVKGHLRAVLDKVDYFNLGIVLYQAGEYHEALLAFEEFLRAFPSREVNHNAGCCHHQLALKYHRLCRPEDYESPFKLSIAADPVTRASRIRLRETNQDPESLFREHVEKAIQYYDKAILQDPSYALSYSNCGAALLVLTGEHYQAVAKLENALKRDPQCTRVLNNLGVAYFHVGAIKKARESLLEAHRLDPSYDAPLFNLGRVEYAEGRMPDARGFWLAYLNLDPMSRWADIVRNYLSFSQPGRVPLHRGLLVESVQGIEVDAFDEELPEPWGAPELSRVVHLEGQPYGISRYSNGVTVVSCGSLPRIVQVFDREAGTSARGISVGSAEPDVMRLYGYPERILDMTQGTCWVYDQEGIAFLLRDRRVAYWLLF